MLSHMRMSTFHCYCKGESIRNSFSPSDISRIVILMIDKKCTSILRNSSERVRHVMCAYVFVYVYMYVCTSVELEAVGCRLVCDRQWIAI